MRWRKDRIAEIVGGLMVGYGMSVVRVVRCPACDREDYFIPDTMTVTTMPGGVSQVHWDCLGCHARVAVFYHDGVFTLKLHRSWP